MALSNVQHANRRVPLSFYDLEFVRSYAREDEEGNLWRYEVRRHPESGQCVQVRTPVTVDKAARPR